jgi:hypothetical protein
MCRNQQFARTCAAPTCVPVLQLQRLCLLLQRRQQLQAGKKRAAPHTAAHVSQQQRHTPPSVKLTAATQLFAPATQLLSFTHLLQVALPHVQRQHQVLLGAYEISEHAALMRDSTLESSSLQRA